MADVMNNDAFSDAAQTMTTMHDGMGKYDLKGLVAVRNTFLVCEEEAEEPTPLELRRGMSEPASKVATMQGEEGEEEEEFDVLPPPSQLDLPQTSSPLASSPRLRPRSPLSRLVTSLVMDVVQYRSQLNSLAQCARSPGRPSTRVRTVCPSLPGPRSEQMERALHRP